MKLVHLFLIIIVLSIPFSKAISLDDYSIEAFIKFLKEIGLYDLICKIKTILGSDVAIYFCECLTDTHKGNCKLLIRDYTEQCKPIKPNIDYLPNPGNRMLKDALSEFQFPKNFEKSQEKQYVINHYKKCQIDLMNEIIKINK